MEIKEMQEELEELLSQRSSYKEMVQSLVKLSTAFHILEEMIELMKSEKFKEVRSLQAIRHGIIALGEDKAKRTGIEPDVKITRLTAKD